MLADLLPLVPPALGAAAIVIGVLILRWPSKPAGWGHHYPKDEP